MTPQESRRGKERALFRWHMQSGTDVRGELTTEIGACKKFDVTVSMQVCIDFILCFVEVHLFYSEHEA